MKSWTSRLERRSAKKDQQKAILLLAASAILIIGLLFAGLPAIFALSTTISNLRQKPAKAPSGNSITPNAPRFVQSLEATASAQYEITGLADPNSTIEIFQNNRSIGTTLADQDGKFTLVVSLTPGDNLFTAQAISPDNQKSSNSDAYNLRLLSQPPSLEIDNLKDGETVKDNPVTIIGKTDPGVSVYINERLAIVAGNGQFSFTLNLSSGDNKIKVEAIDLAGNKAVKELLIKSTTTP